MVKSLPAMQEIQEKQARSPSQEDPLEKKMATHSSILDCNIPWTEELGGYSSRDHKESDVTEHKSML